MIKHLRLLLVPALVAVTACSPATDVNINVDTTSSQAMMPSSESMLDSSEMMDSSEDAMMDSSEAAAVEGEARVITVNVSNWAFGPAVVNVKKGEKVTLRFVDETGNHGVAVPGLGLSVYLPAGETVTAELDTSKAGTFDGFCNVPCGPGHRDMKFQIVVS